MIFETLRKNPEPQFSIIVNCFNGAKYLREALDSILIQSYQNYELIFVDNHSTDDSRPIFESYQDTRFKYFIPDTFIPLGEARNFGISKSIGEIVVFLDSDDIWLPDKLSVQMAEFLKSDVDGIYSQATMFYIDGREINYSRRNNSAVLSFFELAANYDVCISTLAVKKTCLKKLNYVFNSSLEVAEDADLLLRIAHIGILRFVNLNLVRYRVHTNSDSWTKPNAFVKDLDIIKSEYQRIGIPTEVLNPLYDTAHWVMCMVKWSKGDHVAATNALSSINKKTLRIRLMRIFLMLPYDWISPLLRLIGKRVI
jgi:glycosyltransferase involved in cell wall biosynthesis